MVVCAVPGCGNNSDATSNNTFHPLPKSLMSRARWIIALGPMLSSARVCSRHFEASMFKKCGNTTKLAHKAVPTLFLNPSPIADASPRSPHFAEGFDDETAEETTDEVVACRVCLAVDGRLSAISSGMEDMLAALTGVPMPEDGFPCHLCVFCVAKLSNCAAFRDSCRRSTALLRTLAERGPLKMNDIKAIDRNSYQLTNNLACDKVFEFNSDPLIEVKPMIKIEREDSHDGNDNEYAEVTYLNDDFVNDSDAEHAFEIVIEKQDNVKQEKGKQKSDKPNNTKIEHRDEQSKMDDESNEDDISDDDEFSSDTSEETVRVRKNIELLKKIPNRTVKNPRIDIKAFEERYNVEYKSMSKEEQVKEIEDRKMNNKLKYCCDMCGRGFNKEQAMVNHMWSHDPRVGPFECGVCRLRFRFSHKLQGHGRRHRDRFRCRECGLLSRDSTRAKSHFKEHGGGSHACPYCNEAYVRKTSYFNHIRTAHPERNEACDECGETFLSALGVRQHKRMAHRPIDEATLKCKDCDVKFLNASALQRHLELSAGRAHAALWACAACGDSCGSEDGLAAHARDIHPPDQHYCKECDKTFSNGASFALHVERKHRGARPCAAAFRRKPRRNQRGRTLYICEMCGWRTMVAKQLEVHRNSHLGIKPFPCPHCDKKFPTQSALKIHISVHTGERPFQCKQCLQSFTSPSNRWRHKQNVHMRVQATCKYCGKSMGIGSLPMHVRTIHLNKPQPPRKRDRKTENRRKRSADS